MIVAENAIGSLKEITLWMRGVNAPPVIDEDVEDWKDNNEERSRPLGLEPNSNHSARRKADQGHNETGDRPSSLNHKTKEEENEEYTAYKLKAVE